MTKYLTSVDVETYINKEFSDETTPTSDQVDKYIELAEIEFENDVGSFSSATNTEIVVGRRSGVYVSNLPIQSFLNLKISNGDEITPTWTTVTATDYKLQDSDAGFIKLRIPYIWREYQANYVSGYTYENMPENIKWMVFLYTFRYMSKNHLFQSGSGGDETDIIDVEVYKNITKGNPYQGITAINDVIDQEKARFKNKLKTYLKK